MPTIRRCCIVGCLSNSRQNPQLQFFQFPRPENPFHKLWKQACQASLSRILPFKKPVVCALHFRPNCIGGRRLTSSAVPSLRLEVPQNLKAVEQQAMIEEIERSRKCAYINAVVYEWLVRANLNPQLRGSITHGMIKEKAETARQVIGSTSFVADNRWLNRFRETHLHGFAQKLASNQLKPVGSSLWIPDIVQDLQHMFPPTNADRISFENVPEQYFDYMQQQYGEYEEDDDMEQKSNGSFYNEQNQTNNQYAQQQQQQQQQDSKAQQQQQQQRSPHAFSGYESYGHMPYGGGYDDYYYQDRKQSLKSPHDMTPHESPIPSSQQSHPSRPVSHSPHSQQNSPLPQESILNALKHNDSPNPAKRTRYEESNGEREENTIEDLTDGPDESQMNDNGSDASRRSSSSDNDATNDNTTTNGNENSNDGNESSTSSTPLTSLGQNGHTIRPIQLPKSTSQSKTNGNATTTTTATTTAAATITTTTNGHVTPTPTNKKNGFDIDQQASSNSSLNNKRLELQNYAQALEYIKPLEDFVLLKENFRAIGIISHLESVLRKARQRPTAPEVTDDN